MSERLETIRARWASARIVTHWRGIARTDREDICGFLEEAAREIGPNEPSALALHAAAAVLDAFAIDGAAGLWEQATADMLALLAEAEGEGEGREQPSALAASPREGAMTSSASAADRVSRWGALDFAAAWRNVARTERNAVLGMLDEERTSATGMRRAAYASAADLLERLGDEDLEPLARGVIDDARWLLTQRRGGRD